MTHPEAITESVLREWEHAATAVHEIHPDSVPFVEAVHADPLAAVEAIGDLAAEVRILRAALDKTHGQLRVALATIGGAR